MFPFTEKPQVRQRKTRQNSLNWGPSFILMFRKGKPGALLDFVCVCLFLKQVFLVYCEHQKQTVARKILKNTEGSYNVFMGLGGV